MANEFIIIRNGFISLTDSQITGSLNVTAGITGSLFGTASFATTALSASYFSGSISTAVSASYAATASYVLNAVSASYASSSTSASYASYALNGGVTQILAGSNVTLSPSNGLGQVTIVASLSGSTNYNTATGSYGSFYDTGSVAATSATIIYSMSFSTTDISNGVFISASGGDITRVKFVNPGIYNIQFSSQFSNTDNTNQDAVIWIRKNGSDVEDTAGTVGIPAFKAGSNGQVIASWNYYLNLSANDFIQMCWHAEAANVVTLETIAAGVSPTHPVSPSTILNVTRIDTFLSNTGSFSGSFNGNFTGSLLGTASYALTASIATSASYAATASITVSSSYAATSSITISSSYAATASIATSASYALSSSYALSASFAPTNRSGSFTGSFTGSVLGTASYATNALSSSYSATSSIATSASYAATASYVVNALTASYVLTAQTASYVLNAVSASFASTASLAPNYTTLTSFNSFTSSYRSGSFTGSFTGSVLGTASYATNALSSSYAGTASVLLGSVVSASYAATASIANSSSYALTASFALNGGGGAAFPFTGNALISGSLTIQGSGSTLLTISGSNGVIFQITDSGSSTNLFSVSSGSVDILTVNDTKVVNVSGSLVVTGSITGSLLGTASYSTNALSSSYALTASVLLGSVISASYAATASIATSSSYALNSLSSSYAGTASVLLGSVVSASYAATASIATSSSYALTASFALNGGGGGAAFPYTGSAEITGSLTVTGSINSTLGFTGPSITGSTSSSGTLTLSSTSNATKGKIIMGTSYYDEVNNFFGLNTSNPQTTFQVAYDIGDYTGYGQLEVVGQTTPAKRLSLGFDVVANVGFIQASQTGVGYRNLYLNPAGGSVMIGVNSYIGGITTPTALLHIKGGTATAGTAPIKLTSGTALTTPEDGAMEYDTSHLYFTIGSTRYQLDQQSGGSVFPYTGSAIITGSLTVTGSLDVTAGITGSLLGTASFSSNTFTNLKTTRFEMGVSSTTAITVGAKGRKTVGFNGTIVGWKLVTDQSTTMTLDVWKTNNAIPTVANSITGSAPISLTAAQLGSTTTLTGWTTSVASGDVFIVNVNSNNNATYFSLELDIVLTNA